MGKYFDTQALWIFFEVDMESNFLIGGEFFDLQLFGGSGGGGEGGGMGDGDSSSAGEGLGDNVSQADADGTSSGGEDTDPDSEFANLIRGRYKDAFTKRTQNIINRRFRETKELEKYRENAGRVLSALAEKCGADEGDFDGLLEAIGKGFGHDVHVGTDEAKRGSDGDDANGAEGEKDKAAENSSVRARRAALEGRLRAGAEELYARWQGEAAELSRIYPSFDLAKESGNRDFVSLLRSGVSLRRAYESAHYDEIMGGAMEYTARKVTEAISRSIQAKGDRPSENGLGTKSGINPKKDVASLTDSDILEILKQVENGKRISF